MSTQVYINNIIEDLKKATASQKEFHQASKEVLTSLVPLIEKNDKYKKNKIIERIIIPERTIMFRVTWIDDKGEVQVNNGYRVQFNSTIGPYKGGLRFHPSVNLSILKFLGFEQIFKNSLTGLSIGGGKGGSNFNPKGKSEGEIMRFCQAFMTELYRHIGNLRDVPAGDIGVGGREIGYLFGQYKKLTANFEGVLTGKGLDWGGSLGRTEATGYGSVYFAQEMLKKLGLDIEGKTCLVSGAGNVAIYTIEKLYQLGAKPVTCSDSSGMIYDEEGIDLNLLKQIKEVDRKTLEAYKKERPNAIYKSIKDYPVDHNPLWAIPCFAAFPSATQNEIDVKDAKNLIKNNCKILTEGANMPTTNEAIELILTNKKMAYCPGKAANAGGVATSQLEMAQNASMQSWSFEEVDKKLHNIMKNIFHTAYETSEEFGDKGNLVLGANIAGFRKVADGMISQGFV